MMYNMSMLRHRFSEGWGRPPWTTFLSYSVKVCIITLRSQNGPSYLQVYVPQNIRKIYFLHKISRTRFWWKLFYYCMTYSLFILFWLSLGPLLNLDPCQFNCFYRPQSDSISAGNSLRQSKTQLPKINTFFKAEHLMAVKQLFHQYSH